MDCRETQHELKQVEAGKLDENRLRAALEHIRTCASCRGSNEIPFMIVIGPQPPPSEVTEELNEEQIDERVTSLRMKAAVCALMAAYAGHITSDGAEAKIAAHDFTDEQLAQVRKAANLMQADMTARKLQCSIEDYLGYASATVQ